MQDVLKSKVEKAVGLAQALHDDKVLAAAYIGGSIPAGFGNETSDVDLFALVESMGDQEHVVQYNIDGDRVDVEFYTFGKSDEMLSRIGSGEVTATNLQTIGGFKDELDWFSRLQQSSEAVTSPQLSAMHERATEFQSSFRWLSAAYWILFADSMTEDFRGAAAAGQKETAVYASQQMLAAAGKALVASLGDLYFPAKWVFQQIARTCPAHMAVDGFTALQHGRWADVSEPDYGAVTFAAQTLSACATLEVLIPGATASLEASDGSGGPRRSPMAVPVPLRDRALLHFELERQVLLPPLVFTVWSLCDGRDLDAIHRGVESVLAASGSSRSVTRDDVTRIISKLEQQQLVDGSGSVEVADAPEDRAGG